MDAEGIRVAENLGYTLRTVGLVYYGGRALYRNLPTLSGPEMPPTKRSQRLRGSKTESSDLSGAQGRGRAVPRVNPGRDTLLGLARATRRTLATTLTISLATSGGVGTYNENVFTLNGPFNVFGGVSAGGFAKYMAFYQKCYVLGARIKVKGAMTNTLGPSCVTLCVTTNNTSLGSSYQAINNGMCDYAVVNVNPDRVVLDQAVDVSRFLMKPRVLDDPQLFTTSAANPTSVIDAHVGTQSVVAIVGAQTLIYVAEVEQDCIFVDPITFT